MDNIVPVWGMEEDLQQKLGRQRMECMELARQPQLASVSHNLRQ